MPNRRQFLTAGLALPAAVQLRAVDPTERKRWIALLDRIARPVLANLARRELKLKMPAGQNVGRSQYTYLEAIGGHWPG